MAGHKLQIQNALIALLRGISTANGYSVTMTPESVTKKLTAPQDVGTRPLIMCLVGPTYKAARSEDMRLYEATTTFTVVGALKTGADTSYEGKLSDSIIEFQEDIERAILTGASGGLLDAVAAPGWAVELVSESPSIDHEAHYGEAVVYVTVTYYHAEQP